MIEDSWSFNSALNVPGNKVAIFGISANPPTGDNGHTGVVKYLVQTHIFKEIWVLPVYEHIYSEKSKLANFEDRLNMCKLSMEHVSTPQCAVRVLSIEKVASTHFRSIYGDGFKVGTIDVLDFIRKSYNSLSLHLVLGTDTFNDLVNKKWKESDRLLGSYAVHVISRKGTVPTSSSAAHSVNQTQNSLDEEITPESLLDNYRDPVYRNVFHHQVPWLVDVSSTKVRQLAPSLLPWWPWCLWDEVYRAVHPDVYCYMKQHRLYGFCESYYLKRRQLAVLGVSTAYVLLYEALLLRWKRT